MQDKTYHHENLRKELIEEGIKYINANGSDGLSLRKIAKACNVSHNAPYRHFKDKDDLILNMQDYVEDKFSDVLEEAISHSKNTLSMANFGKVYVDFFIMNPEFYKFIFSRDSIYIDLNAHNEETPSNYNPYNIFYKQIKRYFILHKIPQEQQLSSLVGMWSIVHGLAGLATMSSVKYSGDWGTLTEKILKGVHKNE